MTEFLKTNPDTTTDEFTKVWDALDPETKEVCYLCFLPAPSSHPVADLEQREQEG